MRVNEIMTHGVECTYPDATVREAAIRMRSLDVGSMPVCENDRLIGIITDRDLTTRTTAAGADPNQAHVRDAMTSEVVFCFEDQDVQEAAKLMKEKQIRRLPVLNRNKRMVGIVALGDLAVEAAGDGLAGKTLEKISEPAAPRR
jgi:CBS domain-containing protein